MEKQTLYAILPIRSAVVFPGLSVPISVGRPKSLGAFHHAQEHDGLVMIVSQRDGAKDDPEPTDLYEIGTLCKIESVNHPHSGDKNRVQIVITGISRHRILSYESSDPFLLARTEEVADVKVEDANRERALLNEMKEIGKEILNLIPGTSSSLTEMLDQIQDLAYISNFASSYLNLNVAQKQELLEENSLEKRIDKLLIFMQKEKEVLSIQRGINSKLTQRFSKAQRDALLREQLNAIREELGEDESRSKDKLSERIEKANLPEEALKIAQTELKRLEEMPPASAEYHVIRSYLEWLADMPWDKSTTDTIDLIEARKILDEDHFGLESVKKRILQFLAVTKLKNNLKGPIICLVGPPGVGKTSLGQSIARALGRKFIRTSLGGVRDESEIRGHRRTYIGAMPGRIVQSLKRAGVNNPVMMLDEIDKLGMGFHGDPSAALLEVLDPEQNHAFTDHYLDTPFDLSNIFFVATANMLDTIPGPLRDRMEVIEVSGYTNAEKVNIAQRHLVPKQLAEHGLTPEQVTITTGALEKIMSHYTREAGVRDLQRKIAALCRAAAEDVVTKKDLPVVITEDRVPEILGIEKFRPEKSERTMRPGVVTGLAWTPVGGDILFVEATAMRGTGKLILTGQLGDVMKESAQIALSFLRAESKNYSTQFDFEKTDIHLHVPQGAIPKDGPSAGITMLTALASLISGQSLDSKVAMTGEITLRGAVLPIGGLKEKLIAAHRAEIKTVLLPRKNEQDLSEVPQDVKKDLDIRLVDTANDVLKNAFPNGFQNFFPGRQMGNSSSLTC